MIASFLGSRAKAGEAAFRVRPFTLDPRSFCGNTVPGVWAGQNGSTGKGCKTCIPGRPCGSLRLTLTGVTHGGLPVGGAVHTSPCSVLQTTWDVPLAIPPLLPPLLALGDREDGLGGEGWARPEGEKDLAVPRMGGGGEGGCVVASHGCSGREAHSFLKATFWQELTLGVSVVNALNSPL